MPSGKRKKKLDNVRTIAASRTSSGRSAESLKSNIVAPANERCNSVPDESVISTVDPLTDTVPRCTTTLPRSKNSAAFTGRELVCQLERMLSTSDNDLFMFAFLAYDLGIPMAVKMIGAMHRLDAEQIR